ncbi:hypothetical protein QN219_04915 [Sinorhizobium sp. 7-81]|uniref:hypothetical protein n=1 Tax=Sinorhizobium sp. 8-89 TaxID=3049089 RepID=UPI0024C23F74|nr:hypothetical protein [Sinorhizobium sp. 8-89]MDK1489397.1 hypothetical protein [Sinorhizobium sp. 8-89]
MGDELHHRATVDHPELGELSWSLWEYPAGAQNNAFTDSNGHEIVEDLRYWLESEPDLEAEAAERADQVNSIVEWFSQNYEDPAHSLPYISAEGGYQWISGGPYDAREVISDEYPNLPEDVLDAAVEAIEADGITDWAPVRDADHYDLDDLAEDDPADQPDASSIAEIPVQEPGLSFDLNERGRLDIISSGIPDADELRDLVDLASITLAAVEDLAASLIGTNAFPSLLAVAQQYRAALREEKLSIDKIYALGVRLENSRSALRAAAAHGDAPELPYGSNEALESVLALQGPLVLSTKRGRQLADHARTYSADRFNTIEYQVKGQELLNELKKAPDLVEPAALDILSEATGDMGSGPSPQRSNHVAHTGYRNLLIKVAGFAAIAYSTGISAAVGDGFTASIPGAILTESVTAVANGAWNFISNNAGLLREFAAIAGPDMSWLSALVTKVVRLIKT